MQPGPPAELVDGDVIEDLPEASASRAVLFPPLPPNRPALEERNLFAEVQRIAARAATASSWRQYAAIFRSAPSAGGSPAQLGRPWSRIATPT